MEKKKVYIVGFAPSYVETPWDDEDAEIWVLNEFYRLAEKIPNFRATRWFEIHSRSSKSKSTKEHQEFLKTCPVPIYMQEKYSDIPNSVKFPKDEILDFFSSKGYQGAKYFTNSISWFIGLAIYEGFEEIHVLGVDMANDCLAPEMRVLTDDLRWIPAGDLKIGQKLLAFDEHAGTHNEGESPFRQYRCTEVENVQVIKRPSYRIHLKDGTTLTASAGHQWLTYGSNTKQWKRTDELVTSSHRSGRPSRIIKVFDVWDEDKSWEGGYLAGAFDGEGHVTHHGRQHNNGISFGVGFAQRDNKMLEKVLSILEGRFKLHAMSTQDGETCKYSIGGGRAEILRFLGEIRPLRLLENFKPEKLGMIQNKDAVAVESLEYLGEQTVIGIRTGTKTLFVEGFASHNSEYGWQRPSCEYWIGLAEGLGIKLYIPASSDLLKCTQLYAFESDNRNRTWIKTQAEEMNNRIKLFNQQEEQHRNAMMQAMIAQAEVRGAKSAYQEVLKRTQ